MSSCSCEDPLDFRMTGEVVNEASEDVEVRLQCDGCGGKVAYVPSAWLAVLPGLELDDLKNGRCLPEDEHRQITVDLI